MRDILFYLAGVNAAAFGLFVWDKFCAGRELRRVPERTLLAISALGGSPGAFLAQRLVRHKTSKQPFQKLFRAIVALQVLAVIGLAALVLSIDGSSGF